jgi:homopolymeric O-antigen transport system permease protein
MSWLEELWQYRELFYFLAWRDVQLRYRQTVLGAAWAILQPLLTTAIFTVLFSRVAKIPSEGVPYALFAYSGLLPWLFFSGALSSSSGSLVNNSSLVRKVYFPRLAIPGAATVACLLDLAIGFVILLGMMLYYGSAFTWHIFLWPLLLVQMIILTIGIGLILAALNVRYRDVKHAVPFALQIWMYLTPIIYPTKIIPGRYRIFIELNPLTGLVESMRACLFRNYAPNWNLLEGSMITTIALVSIGVTYFRRAERSFADVI